MLTPRLGVPPAKLSGVALKHGLLILAGFPQL